MRLSPKTHPNLYLHLRILSLLTILQTSLNLPIWRGRFSREFPIIDLFQHRISQTNMRFERENSWKSNEWVPKFVLREFRIGKLWLVSHTLWDFPNILWSLLSWDHPLAQWAFTIEETRINGDCTFLESYRVSANRTLKYLYYALLLFPRDFSNKLSSKKSNHSKILLSFKTYTPLTLHRFDSIYLAFAFLRECSHQESFVERISMKHSLL